MESTSRGLTARRARAVCVAVAACLLGSAAVAAPIGTAGTSDTKEPPSKKRSTETADPDRSLRVDPRQTRSTKAPAKRAKDTRGSAPATRAGRSGGDDAAVAEAAKALAAGRIDEARSLLDGVAPERLSRERADDAAYLRAVVLADGAKQEAAVEAYLKEFAKGTHRREATLTLARIRYVQGDYAEADRLLTIFSPGVERDLVGREGLVLRGMAQLGRGDAAGALQFFQSCEGDLKNAPEQESYYFSMSQAALRASRPQEALESLRILLEKHPQGTYAPQALYAMGLSLEALGRGPDAANVFRQVAQRFPSSYEATRVRDRGIRPDAGAGGLPIGGGYALQIGAFSRRDLADALARDLRRAGIPDVTVRQGTETPPLYRVRAGAFASRDEARALGERLRRERGFTSTVVPH